MSVESPDRLQRGRDAQPPLPLVPAFLLCRAIYEDRRTGEHLLIGPFGGVELSFFPAGFRCSLFAQMTNGHGLYQLGLRLRDDEMETVWGWDWAEPHQITDPLEPFRVVLYDLVIEFPRPGRFDFVLTANGEDLARHALEVRPARPG